MHKSAVLHQLQQTYPQNVFTKFIHSFQDVAEVQGLQAVEVKHVDPLKQKGGPPVQSPERRESSEETQTEEEEEGVISKWWEQERFNEDEGTVYDMAKLL